MRHTDHLLSPARALHRVLLLEFANTSASTSTTSLSFSSYTSASIPAPRHHAWTWPPSSTHGLPRAPGTSHPRHSIRTFYRPPSAAPKETAQKKAPRDDDIPYHWVQIADGSGSLSEPKQKLTVLVGLPEGHSLVMVAPPPPPPPRDPDGAPTPWQAPAAICRVVDTRAEAAAEAEAKALAAEEKRLAKQLKQLEFNYAIAPHDMGHKLKRLREFLGRGIRVEALVARKRGSRRTQPEEEEQLVRNIREAALAIPGVTEYKRMDGEIGKTVTLSFQGPAKKKKKKVGKKGKKGEEEEEEEEVEEVEQAAVEVEASQEVNREVSGREAQAPIL
ncbi:hypothetical protein F5Y14DRAFT_73126 [Nemania sp. NC0429]|nr:hypothetical protein F5Y14DRAFT_73126 [Nemania sp. NC0429]